MRIKPNTRVRTGGYSAGDSSTAFGAWQPMTGEWLIGAGPARDKAGADEADTYATDFLA
jgi:hypothetical protein